MSTSVSPIQTTSGFVPFGTYQTWYTTFGAIHSSPHPPLIILHGGPGAGHEYLLPLSQIHKRVGIPVILYDQVGTGHSSHIRENPEVFSMEFFLRELQNLVNTLGLREYDILGYSWGGELALEHAMQQPAGLRKLILFGCGASVPLGNLRRRKYYNALPERLRDAMYAHERGEGDPEEFREARRVYLGRHMIRRVPWPEAFLSCRRHFEEDSTSHDVMMGTTGIWSTGKMEHWSVIDRMHLIQNEVLVIHGAHDFLGGEAVQPLLEGLPRVKGVCFEEASHMVHLEEPERFMEEVEKFLLE